MGPGLIVMVGDTPPAGNHLQSGGQDYGMALAWDAGAADPRALRRSGDGAAPWGAVTGVGHAELIFERLASIFRAAWLGRAEAVRAGLWG